MRSTKADWSNRLGTYDLMKIIIILLNIALLLFALTFGAVIFVSLASALAIYVFYLRMRYGAALRASMREQKVKESGVIEGEYVEVEEKEMQ